MKSVRRNKKELKRKLKNKGLQSLQSLNIWKQKEFQELSMYKQGKEGKRFMRVFSEVFSKELKK